MFCWHALPRTVGPCREDGRGAQDRSPARSGDPVGINATPKTVLLALLALSTVLVLRPWPAADALAGAATDQIRAHIDRAHRAFNAAQPADRRTAVRKVIDQMFDWTDMAKQSLGRHWADRTPEERAEFVQLFTDLFEHAYVSKIELADAERFQYFGDSEEGDHTIVRTKIVTRRGSEIPVDYLTRLEGRSGWRVYDLKIDGVSLVGNYRTQFNSIIGRSSYRALLEKLRAMGKERGLS